MQRRRTTEFVLQALFMAVRRRKPKAKAPIHSDQGRQFTGMDRAAFRRARTLEPSLSRWGAHGSPDCSVDGANCPSLDDLLLIVDRSPAPSS
jgi:hypothetical protein